MTIFNIFTLLGGLAFFLFGMHTMSNGLEKIAGGKLEKILRKMTDKPLKALLLGIADGQIHIGEIFMRIVLEHARVLRHRAK